MPRAAEVLKSIKIPIFGNINSFTDWSESILVYDFIRISWRCVGLDITTAVNSIGRKFYYHLWKLWFSIGIYWEIQVEDLRLWRRFWIGESQILREELERIFFNWSWKSPLTLFSILPLIFWRNMKGFMLQTGDPTNTGKGGESIWGRKFPDEFRASLKVSFCILFHFHLILNLRNLIPFVLFSTMLGASFPLQTAGLIPMDLSFSSPTRSKPIWIMFTPFLESKKSSEKNHLSEKMIWKLPGILLIGWLTDLIRSTLWKKFQWTKRIALWTLWKSNLLQFTPTPSQNRQPNPNFASRLLFISVYQHQ